MLAANGLGSGWYFERLGAVLQQVEELLTLLLFEACGHAFFDCSGPGICLGQEFLALVSQLGIKSTAVAGSRLERQQSPMLELGNDPVHGLGTDVCAARQLG